MDVEREWLRGALLFTVACEKVGLGPPSIFKAEAVTYEALDVELSEPNFPTLVGIAEIAEILVTNRQRASQVARTRAFPIPVAELAMGPVWKEPDIRRFVAEWERKPGRPRKVDESEGVSSRVGANSRPAPRGGRKPSNSKSGK